VHLSVRGLSDALVEQLRAVARLARGMGVASYRASRRANPRAAGLRSVRVLARG
jgi:hypothetical protein